MKSILVLALLSMVLTVGISQAYGEVLNFEAITSDNIRGSSLDIKGCGSPNTTPTITIFNPQGETVMDNYYLNVIPNGCFRNIFSPNHFSGYGEFTGYITHEDIKYDFQFTFKEMTDSTITALQSPDITQQDQDIERLQLQIQKQENRIAELENENFGLKKKITELQDNIQKMTEEFFVTVINQMNWFRTQITS